MSLTDDWKTNKFKTGEIFFISVNKDKPEPATISMDGDFIDMSGTYISPYTNEIEVLAPCDYEELQRLKEENDTLRNRCISLERQGAGIRIDLESERIVNEQLRKLLKECKEALKALGCATYPSIILLSSDINASIGESEEK